MVLAYVVCICIFACADINYEVTICGKLYTYTWRRFSKTYAQLLIFDDGALRRHRGPRDAPMYIMRCLGLTLTA